MARVLTDFDGRKIVRAIEWTGVSLVGPCQTVDGTKRCRQLDFLCVYMRMLLVLGRFISMYCLHYALFSIVLGRIIEGILGLIYYNIDRASF